MEAEQEIRMLEDRRWRAMIEVDVATLDQLLSGELVHNHSSARVDAKSGILNGLKAGQWVYRHVERIEEHIKVFVDTARVTGQVRLTIDNANGLTQIYNNRFLNIWIKRSGEWRMIAWQATPIPVSAKDP
jgi:ketosteroid isomerase-like protein